MKSTTFFLFLCLNFSFVGGFAQELMPKIEDGDVSKLIGSTGIVALNDGSQVVGTVVGVTLLKGQLIDVSLRPNDGEKQKFKPKEINYLRVALSKPTVFTLADNAGNVIRKVLTTQYVFEHPFVNKGKVKPQMMQVLNPGYDNEIKIFPNPDAGTERSINIKGIDLSGEPVDSFIFIKDTKVIYVDRAHYGKDFQNIFGDCPEFMNTMMSSEIVFEGLAGHVLLYDHYCKTGE